MVYLDLLMIINQKLLTYCHFYTSCIVIMCYYICSLSRNEIGAEEAKALLAAMEKIVTLQELV